MDDALDAADQAAVDQILAELQAATDAGLLGLTVESFEDGVDREATMALLTLAIRHFAWAAREDQATLEADPALEARLTATAAQFHDSVSVLAKVALMDALRCLKALAEYRARQQEGAGNA